ncbi:hypothetical protein CLAIMM_12709 [Cladophialophora immunda]|nr:hypothetical protein CLAIMM_12709 [Cladophialophora immunda]
MKQTPTLLDFDGLMVIDQVKKGSVPTGKRDYWGLILAQGPWKEMRWLHRDFGSSGRAVTVGYGSGKPQEVNRCGVKNRDKAVTASGSLILTAIRLPPIVARSHRQNINTHSFVHLSAPALPRAFHPLPAATGDPSVSSAAVRPGPSKSRRA